jgi:hypothetical protein
MTFVATEPTTDSRSAAGEQGDAPSTLHLLPWREPCSLVDGTGRVLFERSGADGRRRCLQFARRQGALVVFS